MSKPSKEPINRELLERITVLETQNAELVTRIAELEKRATNSHNGFIRLVKQVGGVLEDIGSLEREVFELMAKVFPGYIRTQRQIFKVLNLANKPRAREGDENKSS